MSLTNNHTDLPFKLIHLQPDLNEDRESQAHRHNYFELFVFAEEGKNHFIDFKNYSVNKNSIHLVLPGCIHLLKRNKYTKGYVLLFSEDFFHFNFQGNNLWLDVIPAVIKYGASFSLKNETFSLVMELCHHIHLSKDKKMICTYLQLIILHLKSSFDYQKNVLKSTENILSYQFRKLVEDCFSVEGNNSFYAKKLNVSISSLNKKVKEVFGNSPSEIITERTLLEAKRLLFHNEYSSKEIAFKIGFNDDSYFSRFFKKKTGMSPNQFRIQSRQLFK